MDKLENALAALLIGNAYMDEEDACELAREMVRMIEDGDLSVHEGESEYTDKNGELCRFRYKSYRWEPGSDVMTIEQVKEAAAEYEDRISRITGTTAEERLRATATAMLGKLTGEET